MTSRPQSTAPTPISSSRLIGDLLVTSSAFLDLDAGSALCASVARGETNTNRLFMSKRPADPIFGSAAPLAIR